MNIPIVSQNHRRRRKSTQSHARDFCKKDKTEGRAVLGLVAKFADEQEDACSSVQKSDCVRLKPQGADPDLEKYERPHRVRSVSELTLLMPIAPGGA